MGTSTPKRPSFQASATGIDASALSRRELQYLARELELCRGNAKSDVIVEHVVAFMATSDGATRVATLMNDTPDDLKLRTPAATPARRMHEAPHPTVTPRAMNFAEESTPSKGSTRKASRKETSGVSAKDPSATATSTDSPSIARTAALQRTDAKLVSKDETPQAERKTAENNKAISAKVDQKPAKKDITPADKKDIPTKKQKSPAKSVALAETLPATELKNSNESPAKSVIVSDSVKTPPRRQTPTPTKNGRSPLANVSNVKAEQDPKVVAPTLEALLASAGDLVAVASDRVKCTTTGHEMKADVDAISAYISGKRYQRAHLQTASFARFAPMFVDHPDEKQTHLVWCSVTQTSIARNTERIEAHMKAARYQKELSMWQAEQAALAAAKGAALKEQEAKAATRENAPRAKNKARKRTAGGTVIDPRRTKVARSEAK